MGVSYDDLSSPLITESECGIWKAGNRCPDVLLTPQEGGPETWLYSVVSYGKYLLLSIGKHQEVDSKYSELVSPIEIFPSSTPNTTPPVTETSAFLKSTVFTAGWASNEPIAIIVRPDMYIGYVGTDDGWKAYLADLFT